MCQFVSQGILITGNLGYVGQELVTQLSRVPRFLIGVDLDLYGNKSQESKFNFSNSPIQFESIVDVPNSLLSKTSCIIHLAGLPNDEIGKIDYRLTHLLTHESALQTAKIAKAAGIRRFIFASSCSVYGRSPGLLLSESSEPAPMTSYALSKFRTELDLGRLCSSDFSVYLLRIPTLFGWGVNFRNDLFINEIISRALSQGFVSILSEGLEFRPILYVRDLVRVFSMIADKDIKEINGRPLNVGFNEFNFRVIELAKRISQLMSIPIYLRDSYQNIQDTRDYNVSFSLFESIFPDFRPQMSLDEQMKETINQIRNHMSTLGNSVFFQKRILQFQNQYQSDVSRLSQISKNLENQDECYGSCCKSY